MIKELILEVEDTSPVLTYQPGDYLQFEIPAYAERTLRDVEVNPPTMRFGECSVFMSSRRLTPFHVALSKPLPEDGWTGHTGSIHEVLRREYLSAHPDPTQVEYYLSAVRCP